MTALALRLVETSPFRASRSHGVTDEHDAWIVGAFVLSLLFFRWERLGDP